MAKKTELTIAVKVKDNTEEGIQGVKDSVSGVGESMAEKGKEATKDWAGVGELFTGLLPRGMQKTIRSFKSTTRSVGRLSKGFKLLKAAWASVGIGLAIIAVEALIENWTALTDAIGFSNKEQREAQEEFEKNAESIAAINVQGDEYLKVIYRSTEQTEVFNNAVKELNKQFGNAIDTEASLNEQKEQAIKLSAAKKMLDEAQRKQAVVAEKILFNETEILKERNKAEGDRDYDRIATFEEELVVYRANQLGYTQDALKAEVHLQSLIDKTANTIKERENAQKDADTERKKAEQEAERLAAERARNAEQNAQFLADMEVQIANETALLMISNEEERAKKELAIRQQAERQKLIDAGATDKLLYDQQLLHLEEMTELEAGFEAEKQAKRDAQKESEQALRDDLADIARKANVRELEEEELIAEEKVLKSLQKQIEAEIQADQRFQQRLLLAGENAELIAQVEEQHQNELTEIEKRGEAERNAAIEEAQNKELKIREAGQKRALSTTQNMFGAMESMAKENSEAQKAFAITGVLLSQAQALANGIKTAGQSSLTVWDYIGNIAVITTAVLSSFAGIKSILNEATDGGGSSVGGGGGSRPQITPLVPTGVARLDSPSGSGNNQAFVVQSELEGANLQANNMYGQTSLNPG
tara:strand:- start:750 stop:2690 length:1941 start_codon:yes stop_codon:yes gene_type:complete